MYSNTCLVGSFISSVVCPGNLGIKCHCSSVKASSFNSLDNTVSAEVDVGTSPCECTNNDFRQMSFLLRCLEKYKRINIKMFNSIMT